MSHVPELRFREIKDLIDGIKMKLSGTSGQQRPAGEVWWNRQRLGRQQKHRGEQGPVCEQLHHLATKEKDGRVLRREPVQWSRHKRAIAALLLRRLGLCMKRKCVLGFNEPFLMIFVSAPSWRCWEEIEAEKSCKWRWISCRVFTSGESLTSSWVLIQGAVPCKWSARQINPPQKKAKQSYLLWKSSKSVFLTRIGREHFWFSHSHWWKLLMGEKGILYSYLFQSEWIWAVFHSFTRALDVLTSPWMNAECLLPSPGSHGWAKLWFWGHASPVSLPRTASADRRTSLSEATKASAEGEKTGKHLNNL